METLLAIFLCIVFLITGVYAICKNFLVTKTIAMSLEGLHVVITGGSKGIGKALAVEASKRGANVTIIARKEADLREACEELRAICDLNAFETGRGQTAQWFSADVTDPEQVSSIMTRTGTEYSRLRSTLIFSSLPPSDQQRRSEDRQTFC